MAEASKDPVLAPFEASPTYDTYAIVTLKKGCKLEDHLQYLNKALALNKESLAAIGKATFFSDYIKEPAIIYRMQRKETWDECKVIRSDPAVEKVVTMDAESSDAFMDSHRQPLQGKFHRFGHAAYWMVEFVDPEYTVEEHFRTIGREIGRLYYDQKQRHLEPTKSRYSTAKDVTQEDLRLILTDPKVRRVWNKCAISFDC